MQIVLARLDEEQEIVRPGRIDLGERHTYRTVKRASACMWLNKGNSADVARAERFAAAEGYTVYTYEGLMDPLGQAKKDVSKLLG